VDEATTLAVQVLAALDAAHRASLVHRDIKPANVLSAGPDHWKVADFGIAKSVQVSRADDTITGMVLGTPAYLPPERLLGGQAIPAGDVYALGVVVYEALAGRRPFEASDPASWVAVAAAPPIPLRQLRPDVPAALAAAIERSISRDPSRRFADASEMAEAITAPKSETSEGRTGWLAVPPPMPLSGDTEVLPRALNEHGRVSAIGVWSSERLRPRRIWFGGIGVGIAAMIALAVALAISAGPVRAHSPTSTTAVVQTTTTVPTTTLPAVVTPGPGHGHSNGDGGDKGGDSGGHGG
jgi:serine/threonine-protein kinase